MITTIYLNRCDSRTRAKYLDLAPDVQHEVDVLWAHHARMSKKCELGPDPTWLAEMVSEINADRMDFAVEAFDLDFS